MDQIKKDKLQAAADRSAKLSKQKNETERRIRKVNARLETISKLPAE